MGFFDLCCLEMLCLVSPRYQDPPHPRAQTLAELQGSRQLNACLAPRAVPLTIGQAPGRSQAGSHTPVPLLAAESLPTGPGVVPLIASHQANLQSPLQVQLLQSGLRAAPSQSPGPARNPPRVNKPLQPEPWWLSPAAPAGLLSGADKLTAPLEVALG